MILAPIIRIVRISRNVVALGPSVAFYQDRLGFRVSGPAFVMEQAFAVELGFGARQISVQRLRFGTRNSSSSKPVRPRDLTVLA